VTTTPNADAAPLVTELESALAAGLGAELVGLYVFGSLVVGDFDPTRSDIDLLAVVRSPIDDRHLASIGAAHDGFVAAHPEWANRLEILCVPLEVLRAYPADNGAVARVSPGEPLHRTTMQRHWLVDLYGLQEYGVVRRGRPVADVLPRIEADQVRRCAVDSIATWRDWAGESTAEDFVSYAVLTVCRALYTARTGAQVSKARAARDVAERHPHWADLVEAALRWRQDRSAAPNAVAAAELRRFVAFAAVDVGIQDR
jgi:hypothetical protein